MKNRLYGLDVLRIISAIFVCAFHTNGHLGATYGLLTEFVSMSAVFMTLFFILSGYSLFISNSDKSFLSGNTYSIYLKKRFISIVPMYYIASLIYVITEFVKSPGGALLQTVVLFPIELLGIQSVFNSLFSLTHNGGTWFISCILICYLIYPAIQEFVIRISNKIKIFILLVMVFVLLYAPIVVWYFDLSSIYSNPFFRLLEFFIGVFIASMKPSLDKMEFVKKHLYNWKYIILISALMVTGVTIAVNFDITVGNYMLYSWICLPCFLALIVALSGVSFEKMNNMCRKILLSLSKMTYCLFLAQLFSNKISKVIIHRYRISNNLMIIFIGWGVCILITVLLHAGIEKRIKRCFKRLLLE